MNETEKLIKQLDELHTKRVEEGNKADEAYRHIVRKMTATLLIFTIINMLIATMIIRGCNL